MADKAPNSTGITTDASDPRSGIDLSWVEESVRPQDDLFEHVNGVPRRRLARLLSKNAAPKLRLGGAQA